MSTPFQSTLFKSPSAPTLELNKLERAYQRSQERRNNVQNLQDKKSDFDLKNQDHKDAFIDSINIYNEKVDALENINATIFFSGLTTMTAYFLLSPVLPFMITAVLISSAICASQLTAREAARKEQQMALGNFENNFAWAQGFKGAIEVRYEISVEEYQNTNPKNLTINSTIDQALKSRAALDLGSRRMKEITLDELDLDTEKQLTDATSNAINKHTNEKLTTEDITKNSSAYGPDNDGFMSFVYSMLLVIPQLKQLPAKISEGCREASNLATDGYNYCKSMISPTITSMR